MSKRNRLLFFHIVVVVVVVFVVVAAAVAARFAALRNWMRVFWLSNNLAAIS